MNELTISSYPEYKKTCDEAFGRTVEDFVYIGYLLRKAKESPEILDGSGYADYKEFAHKEYNIDDTTISRFVSINIKYGAGAVLKDEYKGFGRAKLQEMLNIPGTIIEEIPKETTKEKIKEIVKDYKEEQKVTPLEAAFEEPEYNDALTLFQNFMVSYLWDHKEEYLKFGEITTVDDKAKKQLYNILAPGGTAAITERIKGKGKYMLSIKNINDPMILVNLRTELKISIHLLDAALAIQEIGCKYSEEGWEEYFNEPFSLSINHEPEPWEDEPEEEIEKVEGEVVYMNPPEEEPKEPEEETKTEQEEPEKSKEEYIPQPDPEKYNLIINKAKLLSGAIKSATETSDHAIWHMVWHEAKKIADFAEKEERRLK